MTPARTRALGAFLLVLAHLAVGGDDALPVNAGSGIVDGAARAQVECTTKACPGAYEYGAVGGMVAWSSRAFLLGGAKYKYQRTDYRHPQMTTVSCSPDIAPHTADAGVTPPAIDKAFAHGDVQTAFESKTPIFYGHDTRPVDGTAFEVKRTSDGRSFLIGSPCWPPVVGRQCTDIPPGLAALLELLLKLDQQQLGHPLCQSAIRN